MLISVKFPNPPPPPFTPLHKRGGGGLEIEMGGGGCQIMSYLWGSGILRNGGGVTQNGGLVFEMRGF